MQRYLPHYRPRRGVECYGCKPLFPFLGRQEAHKLPPDHAHTIRAHATCTNYSCLARDRAIQYLRTGSSSGGGFHFDVAYRTTLEFMVGAPQIQAATDFEDSTFASYPMKRLAKALNAEASRHRRNREEWNKCMKLSGENPLLAVLCFHPALVRPPRLGSRRHKESKKNMGPGARDEGKRRSSELLLPKRSN